MKEGDNIGKIGLVIAYKEYSLLGQIFKVLRAADR
jgi:hypothetical protein